MDRRLLFVLPVVAVILASSVLVVPSADAEIDDSSFDGFSVSEYYSTEDRSIIQSSFSDGNLRFYSPYDSSTTWVEFTCFVFGSPDIDSITIAAEWGLSSFLYADSPDSFEFTALDGSSLDFEDVVLDYHDSEDSTSWVTFRTDVQCEISYSVGAPAGRFYFEITIAETPFEVSDVTLDLADGYASFDAPEILRLSASDPGYYLTPVLDMLFYLPDGFEFRSFYFQDVTGLGEFELDPSMLRSFVFADDTVIPGTYEVYTSYFDLYFSDYVTSSTRSLFAIYPEPYVPLEVIDSRSSTVPEDPDDSDDPDTPAEPPTSDGVLSPGDDAEGDGISPLIPVLALVLVVGLLAARVVRRG